METLNQKPPRAIYESEAWPTADPAAALLALRQIIQERTGIEDISAKSKITKISFARTAFSLYGRRLATVEQVAKVLDLGHSAVSHHRKLYDQREFLQYLAQHGLKEEQVRIALALQKPKTMKPYPYFVELEAANRYDVEMHLDADGFGVIWVFDRVDQATHKFEDKFSENDLLRQFGFTICWPE